MFQGNFSGTGRLIFVWMRPGAQQLDLGIEKSFALPREAAQIQFGTELFNAWNHAQFELPNGNAGAGANFGRISAARAPRHFQFALKALF